MNINKGLLDSINGITGHHGKSREEDPLSVWDNPKYFPESPGFIRMIGDMGSMLFLRDGYPVVYYDTKDRGVGVEHSKLAASRDMVLSGVALFEYYRETGKLPNQVAEREGFLEEFLKTRNEKNPTSPMLKPAILLACLIYSCLESRGGRQVGMYELEDIASMLYVLNEKPEEFGLERGFTDSNSFSLSSLYNAALDEFIVALKNGESMTNDSAMPNWGWSIGFLEDRFYKKATKSFLLFKSENECDCVGCRLERLSTKMEKLIESLDGIEIVEGEG